MKDVADNIRATAKAAEPELLSASRCTSIFPRVLARIGLPDGVLAFHHRIAGNSRWEMRYASKKSAARNFLRK
jgi:hypothetical protein